MMEKINCSNMSNSELKLQAETLKNLFENKKNVIVKLCEEMGNIEKQYLSVIHELESRKNIY